MLTSEEKKKFLGWLLEQEIDIWEVSETENCSPSPSDAFEAGASNYRQELERRLSS